MHLTKNKRLALIFNLPKFFRRGV